MRIKRFISTLLGVMLMVATFGLAACGGGNNDNSEEGGKKEVDPVVCPVTYAAEKATDFQAWEKEFYYEKYGTPLNQACTMPGIVESPYFQLKIDGVEAKVYAERVAKGSHHFAYVDLAEVEEDESFTVDVEITTSTERTNPVVLPESSGVKATAKGKKVTAKISAYGVYTFTFDRDTLGLGNDGSENPLTLMLKKQEKLVVPEGYQTVEKTPGTYPMSELTLTQENTVYHFKKGVYEIDGIRFPSNSVTYFEPGTVLRIKPLTKTDTGALAYPNPFAPTSVLSTNIKILGRPAIDFAFCNGSPGVYKEDDGILGSSGVSFSFEQVDGFEFAGANIINSASWTLCFTGCKNIVVRDLIFLAYRTYSDGIMISGSQNANVSGCFVRTGDDACEVKATGGTMPLKDIVYEYNCVWTDKGIAYGSVYETGQNRQDVVWRHNSVGFALAKWSDHLACTTISMNCDGRVTTDEDLHFEDIEIYTSYCPVTTIVLHKGGEVNNIYFKNIKAKYLPLHERYENFAIDFIVKNEDGGSLTDFRIKNIYFDNIDLAGTLLTQDNKKQLIGTDFAEGFSLEYDFRNYRTIKVNTLTNQ